MNASGLKEVFSYRQNTCDLLDTAGLAESVHEDGFALIPGVLSASEVGEAKEALDRLQPFGLDGSSWSELNQHFKCVFNRDRLWLSYADRPGIIELAEALMGSQCHIIGMTAWKSGPGYDGWRVHVDQVFVPLPESVFAVSGALEEDRTFQLPVWICTAHFYLSDIAEDLCPTYIIPGSHKSGRKPNAGKKLGTDTPQNQFCAKQEMCCFSAVKFGTPAAKIRPQMELATYCKCIIPTATSRRNFRLGRGNLILKLWLLLLNDNCDFWANILSQIMVSKLF
jgi:hypothetical protein